MSLPSNPSNGVITVGITGIGGMIGWHVHANMRARANIRVVGADRKTFATPAALDQFVSGVDVVVHLAGMNRGDETELAATNVALTEALIAACERTGRRPHIIFSSSTHIDLDTPYGRSKRECAGKFERWVGGGGGRFTNLVLPHVFGEGGKPFYNSVVSTFCHQLANSQEPEIIQDGNLELVHAQQVAQRIWELVERSVEGTVRLAGIPMRVSELLQRLQHFDQLYRKQLIPDLRQEIDLYLFNTYRSYLFPGFYPITLELHQDDRGALFEAIKSQNGGQCFISSTRPGITRGNHYHTKKIERFLVIGGKGLIRVRKLFSDEVTTYEVSGDQPQCIDMPTFHTHNITNVGNTEMMVLFWSHEIFDPNNPDTFFEKV